MLDFSTRNGNVISGINDEKMRKAILDIFDIAEKLQVKFNEADAIMDNLKASFSGRGALSMFDKFDLFKTNFAIVVSNVQNYGNDLTKVRSNYHNMALDAASILRNERGRRI